MIDDLRIASPCGERWERMRGDARSRVCDRCELRVYNLVEFSREEIQELIVRTEGRLCARIYRRRDGRIMTRDCGVRRMSWAVKVAALAIGMLLPLVGTLVSASGREMLLSLLPEPVAKQLDPPTPTPVEVTGIICPRG